MVADESSVYILVCSGDVCDCFVHGRVHGVYSWQLGCFELRVVVFVSQILC